MTTLRYRLSTAMLTAALAAAAVSCGDDDTTSGGATTSAGSAVAPAVTGGTGAPIPSAAPAPTPAPTAPVAPATAALTIPEPAAPTDAAALGETVQSGDPLFRLDAIEDPVPPGEFLQPDPGTRWIAFDMTANNPTQEPVGFSSLLAAKLFDADGRELEQTIITDRQILDGDIPAGQTGRGYWTFVVPDGATPSYLQINVDPFGGTAVSFAVS